MIGHHAARFALAAVLTINVCDFGAAGDGVTDDGPAFQAALEALAGAGGGTLFVPAGRYAIVSPVHHDFTGHAESISIAGIPSRTMVDTTAPGAAIAGGLDLLSEIYPRTHEKNVALSVQGLRELLVRDIAFVGSVNVATDALAALAVTQVDHAVVRHCEFYALSTLVGGAVLLARRSGLHVEQTKFLGCTANSALHSPVVNNLEWKSVSFADVVFVDYGNRPQLESKTGLGAPYSWVNIGNAVAVTAESPRREVSMRRLFLDEGGFVGLSSLPYDHQPPTAPIDLYYISGLRMNVSNLATSGNYLGGLDAVLVDSADYGWSHNTDAAIHVFNTGDAILHRVRTEAAATRLRAGSGVGRFVVINSTCEHLASQALQTRVIDTRADAGDPVRYVRRRFLDVLGRAPDPAAHYYWSSRLLACGEGNAACASAERASLDAYLDGSPAANFAIEGTVTDGEGLPVAGVRVTLRGSQFASTTTNRDGRYRFANLPTSGVYNVTAAKEQYTFPPLTFDTPSGDQRGDLRGARSRSGFARK